MQLKVLFLSLISLQLIAMGERDKTFEYSIADFGTELIPVFKFPFDQVMIMVALQQDPAVFSDSVIAHRIAQELHGQTLPQQWVPIVIARCLPQQLNVYSPDQLEALTPAVERFLERLDDMQNPPAK
ncbi:hypothetical protein A3J41_02355 [candidate division TM6 bacterium RIFCSPHIGHO2_12_FULL_38_8]|nr:MAG: hypothetical protein A3J41_02355 [candidate division TM6 bacterium RIFCSPHIGHO2_12_FULL_38_8]